MRVGWRRNPSGGLSNCGRISVEGRSRVRLTYEKAVTIMSAATISDRIIPALRMPLRERASPERCFESRRSRRARRMGMVEGMGYFTTTQQLFPCQVAIPFQIYRFDGERACQPFHKAATHLSDFLHLH